MKEAGLKYIGIPWFEHKEIEYPDSTIGIYINFLEVGNLIIEDPGKDILALEADLIEICTKKVFY